MSEPSPRSLPQREPTGSFREWNNTPSWVAKTIAAVLMALAVAGAYKGLTSVRRGDLGPSLLDPTALAPVRPTAAATAVPLPADPDWSTLQGPQILPPPVKRAPVDQDQSTSDSDTDAPDAATDAQQTPAGGAPHAQSAAPAAPTGDQSAPQADPQTPSPQ